MSWQDGTSLSQTPAKPQSYSPFMSPPGLLAADLVPEGNLSCVPPGHPCREKPLHVPQKHHPVHSVVFAVRLLAGKRKLVSQGPRHQGPVVGCIGGPQKILHVLIPGTCECFLIWKKGLSRCNFKFRALRYEGSPLDYTSGPYMPSYKKQAEGDSTDTEEKVM